MDSRVTTSYIRGVAIAAVLFAHFTQHYHHDIYVKWIGGYALGFVAVFFVLSGLGLYHLFERLGAEGTSRAAAVLKFFSGRAMRIYPLFWLALLLTPLVLPDEYAHLRDFGPGTIAIFLGVPSEKIGVFWFVGAIIECYLLAPFLYALLKKLGATAYLWAMLALTGVLFAATCILVFGGLATVPDQGNLFYRYMLFGNVALFSLGMAIPALVGRWRERLTSNMALFGAAVLFVISISLTRAPNLFAHHLEILMSPLFILSTFALCLFALTSARHLPLKSVVCISGRHSYPLYLFHMFFFGLLAYIGLVEVGSLGGDAIAVALLPVLLAFCVFAERLTDSARMKVGGLIASS